ncbi:glycosyltransferase 87 family protein [Nucisporomicrobium flavum]|uniref:glycosyltransferase 87 family protein n=1 Tax=Nucisporomicrobium flavum TaxID=2785915 RepID=UPI0018F75CE4|nr:glycosyltransferase 87 family protein [Nucisporomicrobium flavum]
MVNSLLERRRGSGPAAAPASSWLRRHRPDLGAAAVYVALGLVVMGRYLADPDGTLSAHLPPDNTWFQWLLSHGAYSVRHLENPLFSARQNVPDGVNMMANTSVLGVTLPLAPVTMLAGPRVAYVVWMAGACAGTAFSAYWVLRRHLVRSRAAAFAGGALAGFAPGVIHHANGQPNFVSNFALPLIVAAVARLGAGGRVRRDGVVLGLLVTYQLFVNEELLLITAVGCLVMTIAYAAFRRDEARRRARAFLGALGVTAAVAGVLCAYPIWFQFHGPMSFASMPFFTSWGEDPLTYLTFSRDTLAGGPASEAVVGRIEQNSWFGWPLTLVAVLLAVVLWRRSVAARVAAVTALAAAVLSLGPVLRVGGEVSGEPGPLAWLPRGLPVLGLLMPSRFTYVVIGALVVLVALGWDRLPWRTGRYAIAAALLPLAPTPVPAMPEAPPPVFISSGAWRPYVPAGSTLVPVPVPSNWAGRETLGWSAAALHEFPVPEGYFLGPGVHGTGVMGPARPGTLSRLVTGLLTSGTVPVVSGPDRAAAQAEVRRWNGSVLVLRADAAHEPMRILVEQIFGPPRRVLDVWLWQPVT